MAGKTYGGVGIAALSVGGGHEGRDEEDGGAHVDVVRFVWGVVD